MPHLLDIEKLSQQEILNILTKADEFIIRDPQTNKVSYKKSDSLKNKNVYNLFFEPSTRTRVSFEAAAKNLGASVINIDVANSSVKKGESLKDTSLTLKAMHPDALIIRHSENGVPEFISEVIGENTAVINGGDGINAHPTQALLDVYTILKHKKSLDNLKITIIGDVLHSRVARSLIAILKKLNCKDIHIVAPEILLPAPANYFGKEVRIHKDLKSGIAKSDVVVCLRLQRERMQHALILDDKDFFIKYGLTMEILQHAKPDAIVLHPGPINRNIEISSEVADSSQAVILEQVTNGVAIRMAVLSLFIK